MRLLFTVVLATCLQFFAKATAQVNRITLDMQKAPVSKVLKAIEKQIPYKFVYSNDFFSGDNLVSVQVKDVPLANVLTSVLEKTGFTFKMVDESIIVIMKATLPAEVQSAVLKGRVTTEEGSPLEGVSIAVNKPAGSTMTNAKGEYSITADNDAVISFSFVGYERRMVPVEGRSEINISLKSTSSTLKDLVVIGYGSVKKSDVTGSVSSISSEKITQVNAVSTVAQALQGQAALYR